MNYNDNDTECLWTISFACMSPLVVLDSRWKPVMGLSPSNAAGVHAMLIVLPLASFNSNTGGSGGTSRQREFSRERRLTS